MQNERIWELLARKIANEASDSELMELADLLKARPDLHFQVQTFLELYNNHPELEESWEQGQQAYNNHIQRMEEQGHYIPEVETSSIEEPLLLANPSSTARRSFTRWSVAAGFLLLLTATAWLWNNWKAEEREQAQQLSQTKSEVYTKNGSKTRIQLPDGSLVWLNAGSKLNYKNDFGKDLREVELIGEAFFDVVKNPKKPFVIHTSTIDVKVLGTAFNVKSYPGEKTTETSLVRGSVEVVVKKRPQEKYILKPNEKIVVLNELELPPTKIRPLKVKAVEEPLIAIRKLTYSKGDSISVETAWAYNKLSFDDEPFLEVARKMERWYDVNFEFRNTRVEDIRLQGSFINETLPQAMEALKYTNRFNYEIQGKKVIVY